MAKMTLEELVRERFYEEWLAKGPEKWLERDREKWRVEGRGEALLELLAERYGQVPGEIADRVRSAGLDELRGWSREVLRSPDLDGVFRTAR